MGALTIAPEAAESLRAGVANASGAPEAVMPTFMEQVVQTIPVNPVRAAADAAMLPLVVFAALFATALRKMEVERREPIVGLFQALGEAMLVLVRWVLVVAPIGIFALALGLGMRMGASAAGALLHYVVVFCIVLVVYTLLLYPAVILIARIPLKRFAAAVAPAQGIALSSRASLTALPALITGARDQLKAPPHVTGFVLPLAISVLRTSAPMAWILGVLFLGKLYGINIEAFDLAKVFTLGIFLSFSVPGIPSASLFLLTPLLVDMGFPAGAVGILIAVDAIPDMFKTALNVTAHMAVAAMLGGKPTDSDPPPAAPASCIAA
jgi:Na+/H+-dicarboxylate symporter